VLDAFYLLYYVGNVVLGVELSYSAVGKLDGPSSLLEDQVCGSFDVSCG
jgi:hypothetical protein